MGGILCGVRKAAVHAWPNAETYTHEAISPGVGPLRGPARVELYAEPYLTRCLWWRMPHEHTV